MKKICLLLILGCLFALSACASSRNTIEFTYSMGSEILFDTTEELVRVVDYVFVGVIDSISFSVVNSVTGRAPTANCNPSHLRLITIYDVNVLVAYKGAERDAIRLLLPGGIRGYREMEQLAAMQEAGLRSHDGVYRISIFPRISPLEVGVAYLFSVIDLSVDIYGYSNFVGIHNSVQSLINLNNPFEVVDDYSGTSAQAIINEFGDSAFNKLLGVLATRDP